MLARLSWFVASVAITLIPSRIVAAPPTIHVTTPMAPPAWAVLERELLRANETACLEFYDRYFDDRGYLECIERWGGDDGPDDAIENLADWPILHALGAEDVILERYKRAWEGHLRQYTLARTTEVPFARDGMYYKEFPVMFDWVHHGEGLTVFNLQGLSDPRDERFGRRVRRFAGFYMNEDPQAANYDPQHKIIKSLFNGSRGPLLRKATALDWAGDPIEVKHRFAPRHGEDTYEQMLEHFEKYNDVVGDHPQNLGATSLAFNAYALTGEAKYKSWLLDYVDAWTERTRKNGGIIPTNVGLDGKIGGAAGGKWYGGVYGWGFSVLDPGSKKMANRNTHILGLTGFTNAALLSGDDSYLDAWRTMIDTINGHGRTVDGRTEYPTMYGDQGWYAYTPAKYAHGVLPIWYITMRSDDRLRVGESPWLSFLEGKNPGYPEQALSNAFLALRKCCDGMRADRTTPDTRLADDPMPFNPATVQSLVQLMLGGIDSGHVGAPLHCRVRYFDPIRRRAGIPKDVAALVSHLTAEEMMLTLVNVNPIAERTLVVQAGGYGEHHFLDAQAGDASDPAQQNDTAQQNNAVHKIDAPHVTVKLAPSSGSQFRFRMKRYAHRPTMAFPWDSES